LLRREPLPIPFRSGGLLDRWPSRPRTALQRSSVAATRCLESVSTTDVHVTSTRRKHPFRRLPVERRGENPPTFDFETARPFRLSPRRSSGAGPPRGHPTSNGLTLDGVRAGFGPDGYLFSQRPFSPLRLAPFARRGSARALSAQGASADSDPLTPLAGVWIEIRAF